MTQILFYHDVEDRLAAVCHWLYYAYSKQEPVLVYAPDPAMAERIDKALWCMEPLSFVAHVRYPSELAAQTPIVITSTLEPLLHDRNLLNLSNDIPPGFARFQRVIEFVASADRDPDDATHARMRYRTYKSMGYPLRALDMRCDS